MALYKTGIAMQRTFKQALGSSYFIPPDLAQMQVRHYAARKHTRAKADKKKVKVEIKKLTYYEKLALLRQRSSLVKRTVEVNTEVPEDNVYFTKLFKTHHYSMAEAFQNHKEAHNETILNTPNAEILVSIELNMVAEKKTRFVDKFDRIVLLPFPLNKAKGRKVIAFCSTPEQTELAINEGADLAGGSELINSVQKGDISLSDYQFLVAHPLILPELLPLRGLSKQKFPNIRTRTLGIDLVEMINRCKYGLEYQCIKNPDAPDMGLIVTPIGKVDMQPSEVEANFEALVRDINIKRPKRDGDFISWVWCSSPPSTEKFSINYEQYLQDTARPEVLERASSVNSA